MITKTFPRPCTCTKTSWMWLTIITIFSSPSSSTNTFIGLIKMEKNWALLFLILRRKIYNSIIKTDTKKIGQRQKWLLINIFHFSSDFDESWWDCSTHEYYNVTNFHQNWMKNRNLLLHVCFWLCPIFFVSDLIIFIGTFLWQYLYITFYIICILT